MYWENNKLHKEQLGFRVEIELQMHILYTTYYNCTATKEDKRYSPVH